jgi:hypothetical protein
MGSTKEGSRCTSYPLGRDMYIPAAHSNAYIPCKTCLSPRFMPRLRT